MPKHCVEACWVPKYEIKRKYKGTWRREEKLLFPGYLFIRTEEINRFQHELKRFPEMTKLLEHDGKMNPLTREEEFILDAYYRKGDCVRMSYGVQTENGIQVQEGPLKGRESLIRRVDRHKRRAYVKIELPGKVVNLELGLEIVEKQV